MFIGQDQSLGGSSSCCSGKEGGANTTAVAASAAAAAAKRALLASPPLFSLSPPATILTPTAERTANLLGMSTSASGLSTTSPSANVATVTAASPCLLAFGTSLALPPCHVAQPDDQVPKKIPREKGIMRPNMNPFLLVIFSLMDMVQPHVKVGHPNSRATSKWKELNQ
jgi:hypothetical protein